MNINLTKEEYEYIIKSNYIDGSYKNNLSNNSSFKITLDEEQADDLRDLLGERLEKVGFDLNYNLTTEGAIIEELVDKLFIG